MGIRHGPRDVFSIKGCDSGLSSVKLNEFDSCSRLQDVGSEDQQLISIDRIP